MSDSAQLEHPPVESCDGDLIDAAQARKLSRRDTPLPKQ